MPESSKTVPPGAGGHCAGPARTEPIQTDAYRTEQSGPAEVTASSSDADLIAAARLSDARAYGILYERHAPAANQLARQIVRRSADVDDVVAETFARVLGAIRRGSGPSVAFRPYLLTAVRRVAFDQSRGDRDQIPTDHAHIPEPGEPFIDPVLARLENSLVTRAFMALPERWSAVLWHTEIEQARPAEVARLLGISPNSVSALSYRAREGLRQAYLQMHLSSRTRLECKPVAGKLGAHVRGGLSRRDARQVDTHLNGCRDCTEAHAELASINGSLHGAIGPAILGSYAAGYLASGSPAASGADGTSALRWLKTLMWHKPLAPVAAGVVAAAILLPTAVGSYPHLGIGRDVVPFGLAGGGGGSAARPGGSPGTLPPGRSPSPPASPVSAPTASPTGAPTLSPTAPPGGSPTASPTITATASPGPGGTPLLAARLSVAVSVGGLLDLGLTAVVDVTISDPGNAPTGRLTTDLTLPPGTIMLGLSGTSAWSCATSAAGVTSCTHAAVAAGATAKLSVSILVVSLAGCGSPIGAAVTSGTLSAAGESAAKVQCDVPLL